MTKDKVTFRLMNSKGDEVLTYSRDDAIAEFEKLNMTMTPMVMRGAGAEGATQPTVITELGNEEDVTWLPRVAGG